MKSVYATDSPIAPTGHGGGTVSHHELQALTRVSEVTQIYQRVALHKDPTHPLNGFISPSAIAANWWQRLPL